MQFKKKFKILIQSIFGFLLDALFFPCAIVTCFFCRWKPKRKNKSVLMGMMPNNNLVYIAEALKKYQYEVKVVPWIIPDHESGIIKYDINIKANFPSLYDNWFGQRILLYGFFIWAIYNFDIFFTPFQNRLLDRTNFLKWYEFFFIHLAGRKSVLNPYGSDIYTPVSKWKENPNRITVYEGWMQDPNYNATDETYVRKNRIYCEKNADSIIAGLDLVDYLERIDHKIQLRCIDTVNIQANYSTSNKILKILHAPNHRHLKGTAQLIEAVDEINSQTYQCELVIAEKMSNVDLMNLIETSDIIADQFLVGAYGRFAIEAMARGKPVLCYLRDDLSKIYSHWNESGIVNTSVKDIKKQLLNFIHMSHDERENYGKISRKYVEKYHSYEYVGFKLHQIIQAVLLNNIE